MAIVEQEDIQNVDAASISEKTESCSMTEDEIRKALEQHGYTLDKIVCFKKSDRIKYHSNNRNLKIALNLSNKIRDIPLEAFERWLV